MSKPTFGLVGQGRWGRVIHGVLTELDFQVTVFPLSRKSQSETALEYASRVRRFLGEVEFDILWLATSPQDQFILLCEGLHRTRHIIIEKPLLISEREALVICEIASATSSTIGVNYQYCFLEEIFDLKKVDGLLRADCIFDGIFTVPQPNRLSISPEVNLGIHLAAIKLLHFPEARLGNIISSYESENRRSFKITCENATWVLDFTENRQPLVQRFLSEYIGCVRSGERFKLDIEFSKKALDLLSRS